jgi:EpsI family protein
MSNRSFIISLLLLIGTLGAGSRIASRGNPAVVATNLENLPLEIAGFKATEDFFPDSVYQELDAHKHVYRHYRSTESGQQVDLYIGYYGTAKGGRTPHNPYACLPGAGWGIVEAKEIGLTLDHQAQGVRVNYILARKGEVYDSVLHWYQSDRDKILSSGIQQNLQRFFGRVFRNRNDGAFVRVSVMSREGGIEQSRELVQMFSKEILKLLPQYWPQEASPRG